MSPSEKGTSSELIVATDLLGRGFEVFRSLSPDGSCDLIALKDGRALRIEVKTARTTGKRHKTYPAAPNELHDVLAVVIPGVYSAIDYSPALG